MARKPINPNIIDWNTVESTLNNGKTNFKILGKATGVSASTIRRLMLARYGSRIVLKRGRAVGGISWSISTPQSVPAQSPSPSTEETTEQGNSNDTNN